VTAPELSVVVPAHDEADYLEESIDEMLAGLRARELPFDLVIVENGSGDSTAAEAEALSERHAEVSTRSIPTPDYGNALRSGILAAVGDIVVTFDVDYFSFDFLDHALAAFAEDPELAIVVGSKRAPGAHDRRPWTRRLVTATFSALLRAGFGLRTTDTHGMKALRRTSVRPLARACRHGQDLFDTELVIRAERAGAEVRTIGVTAEERRPSRTPILHRVPRTLRGLARLRTELGREPRARP